MFVTVNEVKSVSAHEVINKNKKQGTIMSIYSDAAIASLLVPKAGSEIFKTIPN